MTEETAEKPAAVAADESAQTRPLKPIVRTVPRALIEGGKIHGTRPRDGEPLDPVEITAASDLPAILARARKAQAAHAALDLDKRASLLHKLARAVLSRGQELVDTLIAETGKPEAEAWLHEVVPTADLGEFWGLEGPVHLAPVEPQLSALDYPGKRAVVERVPRGVVALITPWNFPVALPLRALFPALLAGNAVVWKPSEHTPRCAAILARATAEVYGPDLVVVVQGGGDLGAALIGAGVDAVCFTGSVATGKKVAHAAADALIPVALELGGKDAAVVLEDADVERTARGILWGAFMNAGQNCAGIERVYALPKIATPLRVRLKELTKELVVGRDFGPLVNERQLGIVEKHVASAKAAGAEVITGGERIDKPGNWYTPTVLGDVAKDDPSMVEETFGPVVPVVEVKNEAAAIEAANASRYGLTASVWTRDLVHGEEVARKLKAGVTMVNNHGFTGAVPSLPWTGVGDSGYGVTNSLHSLDIFTRPRAIVVDMRRAKREMWWHPYTDGLVKIGRSMAILRGGGGFVARIKAFFTLLGGFVSRWKT